MTGVYSDPTESLYLHLGPQYHVVALVFIGKPINGAFEENPETYGFRYFDVDALPPLLKGHRHRIIDALQQAPNVFIQ